MLIKLTEQAPHGQEAPVWINPQHVVRVHGKEDGTGSILWLVDGRFTIVTELPERVVMEIFGPVEIQGSAS